MEAVSHIITPCLMWKKSEATENTLNLKQPSSSKTIFGEKRVCLLLCLRWLSCNFWLLFIWARQAHLQGLEFFMLLVGVDAVIFYEYGWVYPIYLQY